MDFLKHFFFGQYTQGWHKYVHFYCRISQIVYCICIVALIIYIFQKLFVGEYNSLWFVFVVLIMLGGVFVVEAIIPE